MRIICMSHRMDEYIWAFYQQDTLIELARQHELFFYGPGFAAYDINDGWKELYAKCPFSDPDIILYAHSWLADRRGEPIDQHPKLQPSASGLPTVLILNKEYANLEEKLRYIQTNRINLVLTHHHNTVEYQHKTGCRFHFWPFAVNISKFPDQPVTKKYDISFTGTLQNKIWPESQSDIRLRIQKKLFYCFLDAPVLLRRRYRKWNIFWKSNSRYPFLEKANMRKRLEADSYMRMLAEAHAVINCLSPLQLVGTRYFEAMASRSLVLCEESSLYDKMFTKGQHYLSFKADLSDFNEIVEYSLNNKVAVNEITQRAYDHVKVFHTWEKRIHELNGLVAHLL